eukprot:g7155.t1
MGVCHKEMMVAKAEICSALFQSPTGVSKLSKLVRSPTHSTPSSNDPTHSTSSDPSPQPTPPASHSLAPAHPLSHPPTCLNKNFQTLEIHHPPTNPHIQSTFGTTFDRNHLFQPNKKHKRKEDQNLHDPTHFLPLTAHGLWLVKSKQGGEKAGANRLATSREL